MSEERRTFAIIDPHCLFRIYYYFCRYMARELLDNVISPAVDIVSLALTLYEMCNCVPATSDGRGSGLPGCGAEWQALREGNVPPLREGFGVELQTTIVSMLHPEPAKRPSLDVLLAIPEVRLAGEAEADPVFRNAQSQCKESYTDAGGSNSASSIAASEEGDEERAVTPTGHGPLQRYFHRSARGSLPTGQTNSTSPYSPVLLSPLQVSLRPISQQQGTASNYHGVTDAKIIGNSSPLFSNNRDRAVGSPCNYRVRSVACSPLPPRRSDGNFSAHRALFDGYEEDDVEEGERSPPFMLFGARSDMERKDLEPNRKH